MSPPTSWLPLSLPLLLLLLLLLGHHAGQVAATVFVVSPESLAVNLTSAFIVFGDDARLERAAPQRAGLLQIKPREDCQLPPAIKSAPAPVMGLVWEADALAACTTMTSFYQAVQEETNIRAVIVGTTTFSVPGGSLGYRPDDDPSKISVMVTYVVTKDFLTLNSSDEQLEVTFDTDRGKFHGLLVSPIMLAYRCIFPIIFILESLNASYMLFWDLRKNDSKLRRSTFLLLALISGCLGRAAAIAAYINRDYYLAAPATIGENIGGSLLFWLPLAFGTLAYTLASFTWADIVTALENNRVIRLIRLPFIIYFSALIPVFVIIGVVAEFYPAPRVTIFSVLLMVAGMLEAFMFLYFGAKVLLMMSKLSSDVYSAKTKAEKRLTLFVIGAVLSWILVVILIGIYFVFSSIVTSDPTLLFAFGVMREIILIFLAGLILLLLHKANRPPKETSKKLSTQHSSQKDTEKELEKGSDIALVVA